MIDTDEKSLRDRLEAVNISQNIFAAFATVHDADVSRVVRGLHVAAGPVERMMRAIEELEDIAAADPEVRIDFSCVANIKAAQKRLNDRRAFRTLATDKRTVAESSQS